MGKLPDNVDESEISKFTAMAGIWWEKEGALKVLHDINPVRVHYIDTCAGLAGKRVLDIGCGGGILSEAMARSGAKVTGIDMAVSSLEAARTHGNQSGLKITYLQTTAEDLAKGQRDHFDIITCMELIEHVPDPRSIVHTCSALVKPNGHIFFGTINRTWLAHLFVIVLAEHVFGIVQKGTHTHKKFIKPSEMENWAQQSGMKLQNVAGLRYIPFIRYSALTRYTGMNYLMHFRKP